MKRTYVSGTTALSLNLLPSSTEFHFENFNEKSPGDSHGFYLPPSSIASRLLLPLTSIIIRYPCQTSSHIFRYDVNDHVGSNVFRCRHASQVGSFNSCGTFLWQDFVLFRHHCCYRNVVLYCKNTIFSGLQRWICRAPLLSPFFWSPSETCSTSCRNAPRTSILQYFVTTILFRVRYIL